MILPMHSLVVSLLEAQAGEPIPLTASEFKPRELPAGLMSIPPDQLFPDARDAKAAFAGLLLTCGHWDLSHQVSQAIHSREGNYWHAIAHRIEPDSWNAGYWFRQVGDHPVFTALNAQARTLLGPSVAGWHLTGKWNPHQFLIWCDEARKLLPGEKPSIACRIQRLECDLLLSWCALKTKDL